MKILKRILLVLIIVSAVGLFAVVFWGGHVVKHGVNLTAPRVLGVPVTLEHARFNPIRGHLSLGGLVVGNPEGFNTVSIFDMKHLEVDLDARSLFSDTIVIRRILIDTPQITYEAGLRRTNLGELLKNVQAQEQKESAERTSPTDKSPGKTVVINELQIVAARAQVSATAMGGRVVPVQLATITLNNLGGEDQSMAQITTEVLTAILGAVGNAVAGAGDLLGDGLKSALSGAGDVGGMVTDRISVVTGTATGGAEVVAGAVGEGVGALKGTIGKGLGQLRRAAGGTETE